MKKIVLVVLVLLSNACFAGSIDVEKRAFVKSKFDKSIVELSKQEAACKSQRKTLPVEKISALGITKKEQSIALQYFYTKAMLNCADEQLKNYLVASAMLRALENNLSGAADSGNELIIQSHIDALDAELKFNTLNPETKAKLATVAELQQPFKPMEAAKRLGL